MGGGGKVKRLGFLLWGVMGVKGITWCRQLGSLSRLRWGKGGRGVTGGRLA